MKHEDVIRITQPFFYENTMLKKDFDKMKKEWDKPTKIVIKVTKED